MCWVHSVSYDRQKSAETLVLEDDAAYSPSLATGAQLRFGDLNKQTKLCLPVLNLRSSTPLLSPPPAPHPAALSLLPTTQNWFRQLLLPPGALHGWIPDSDGLPSDTTSSEQPSSCHPQKEPCLSPLLLVLICFFLWHLPLPAVTGVLASSLRL